MTASESAALRDKEVKPLNRSPPTCKYRDYSESLVRCASIPNILNLNLQSGGGSDPASRV